MKVERGFDPPIEVYRRYGLVGAGRRASKKDKCGGFAAAQSRFVVSRGRDPLGGKWVRYSDNCGAAAGRHSGVAAAPRAAERQAGDVAPSRQNRGTARRRRDAVAAERRGGDAEGDEWRPRLAPKGEQHGPY
jgi:hypothetical protein